MTKVQHPKFPDLVRDVDDVQRWERAGWQRVETEGHIETIRDWLGHVVDTISIGDDFSLDNEDDMAAKLRAAKAEEADDSE